MNQRPWIRDEAKVRDLVAEATHYILGGPEYLSDGILKAAPRPRMACVMGTGTSSFIDVAAACARGGRPQCP
jgi:hypothetical protein